MKKIYCRPFPIKLTFIPDKVKQSNFNNKLRTSIHAGYLSLSFTLTELHYKNYLHMKTFCPSQIHFLSETRLTLRSGLKKCPSIGYFTRPLRIESCYSVADFGSLICVRSKLLMRGHIQKFLLQHPLVGWKKLPKAIAHQFWLIMIITQ
jgi:hypothetical protein